MEHKKIVYINPNNDFKTILVINKECEGMLFKYDYTGHCYVMSMVGEITTTEAKELIKKYANN